MGVGCDTPRFCMCVLLSLGADVACTRPSCLIGCGATPGVRLWRLILYSAANEAELYRQPPNWEKWQWMSLTNTGSLPAWPSNPETRVYIQPGNADVCGEASTRLFLGSNDQSTYAGGTRSLTPPPAALHSLGALQCARSLPRWFGMPSRHCPPRHPTPTKHPSTNPTPPPSHTARKPAPQPRPSPYAADTSYSRLLQISEVGEEKCYRGGAPRFPGQLRSALLPRGRLPFA